MGDSSHSGATQAAPVGKFWPPHRQDLAKKKKRNREFGVVEQAHLRARHAIGTPPPTRDVSGKKHKPPKHKKQLIEEELAE